MSLISTFITGNLIKMLEAQLVAHEPELQKVFLDEIASAVNAIVSWVNSKIDPTQSAQAAPSESAK